jgi:pSer/pThr/pTyr-binding forkhead associated (FHA) protein
MIWVEILSRHRDVVSRHRCDGAEIHIGRGYDNDVIVDDPYVAPRHLRVFHDEDGKLVAEDMGSTNGLFADGSDRRQQRIVIEGDRPLRIGRTHLRIREASHVVAPERTSAAATHARAWPLALGLAAAVLVLELVSLWLAETTEPKVSRYLLPPLILAILTLAWTTAWAILTRIFAGQARFERHLIIALSALLVFSVYAEVADVGAFALSWRVLADYSYIGAWALLAGLCWLHLREIGPAHLKQKAGVVAGLAIAAVAAQTLAQSELRGWVSQQSYLRDLKPPMLRMAPAQDDAAFFGDALRLKTKLDRARKEESPSAGLPGSDSDE